MVKRAKLTLDHTYAEEHLEDNNKADFSESVTSEQASASGNKSNLGKLLLLAGLTIASLIIFRQKIF